MEKEKQFAIYRNQWKDWKITFNELQEKYFKIFVDKQKKPII